VFVSRGDVYVVGYEYEKGQPVTILWKNGAAKRLTDGITEIGDYTIKVSGNSVLVEGLDEKLGLSVAQRWTNG